MNPFRRAVRRYRPAPGMSLPDRAWPGRTITRAPRWLSTDLRDGNQSLVHPMSPERKLMMFRLLVELGYTEIEVGFPVASQDDHDFLRRLIEFDLIPDDVRISVLVQAREELIKRTVESLAGARSATIHIYNATSPQFRRVVFGLGRDEVKQLAVRGTELMMKFAEESLGGTELGYQYSPELFNDTEPEFALEVCEAVMDVWEPGPGRPIILNFPTTVERTTPNIFADRVEWLDRNFTRREHVCLSVHPHNDRGTGVATAELAVLAGAERIEGCLFGNGERAGNVDLVTLALNLFSQGIDPGLDFSDLNRVRRVVEHCTELPVHPRHPYGGDLVYTAFSGSHQDAINKGFAEQSRLAEAAGITADEAEWDIPYLPVDPQDLGRTYESVVRINSQSGKGGVAYVLSTRLGLHPPRELQVEFARVVQAHADAEGGEIDPDRICGLFQREYVAQPLMSVPLFETMVPAQLHVDGAAFAVGAARADEVDEIRRALLRWNVDVRAVHRTGTGLAGTGLTGTGLTGTGLTGTGSTETGSTETGSTETGSTETGGLAVYAQLDAGGGTFWGAGMAGDLTAAVSAAVRSAAARVPRTHEAPLPMRRPGSEFRLVAEAG